MDIVYTWVDDSFPGYLEQLNQFAETPHDLNPNRTRDNLDLLKYSLRSLEQYAPWAKTVTLVSMRPQIPEWLNPDHSDLTIIHHDDFFLPQDLPTFNSFSILSNLFRINHLGDRFLYLEDDMLFSAPIAIEEFQTSSNKIKIYPRYHKTPDASQRHNENTSPWNRALANGNHLLDQKYGKKPRQYVNHVPFVLDKEIWAQLWTEWPDEMAHTSHSKFRSTGNVAPEYLYLHYLIEEGYAEYLSLKESYFTVGYHGLENYRLWNSIGLCRLSLMCNKVITLNDNFGDAPKESVVSHIKRYLEKKYPNPSRFEI